MMTHVGKHTVPILTSMETDYTLIIGLRHKLPINLAGFFSRGHHGIVV